LETVGRIVSKTLQLKENYPEQKDKDCKSFIRALYELGRLEVGAGEGGWALMLHKKRLNRQRRTQNGSVKI